MEISLPGSVVDKGALLAEPGRSTQHSRLPKRKNHGLSRQTGPDPKDVVETADGDMLTISMPAAVSGFS